MGVEYIEPDEREEETTNESETTAETASAAEISAETTDIIETRDECPWKQIRYNKGPNYAEDIDNEFPDIYESDPD